MRKGTVALLLVSLFAAGAVGHAVAQEPRLEGRVPQPARAQVNAMLDSARAAGLPTEPLVDRALEGAAKGATGDLIIAAVRRLFGELRVVRHAFGDGASAAELSAGASALRAGAGSDALSRLRRLRAGRPVTVAAGVLADLVAAGVPADTAVAVVLTLAQDARDIDYVAFRRNVERDIDLGASPAAALGVRAQAMDGFADAPRTIMTEDLGGSRSVPRKRKP